MYKKAAEKFAKEAENKLGTDFETPEAYMEALLKIQMQEGMLSPKGLDEYNLRNEFLERKDKQESLPVKERKSNRGITDDMSAENNCSFSRMFSVVRHCYYL